MESTPSDRYALDVVCFGGAAVDRTYRVKAPLIPATSNPAVGYRTFGGVARNVAENLARLARRVGFVSVVGDDEAGLCLLDQLSALGVDISGCAMSGEIATAEYAAVLDGDGELLIGLAAMDAFDALTPATVDSSMALMQASAWVFADTNAPAATMAALLAALRQSLFLLAVDTVSVAKSVRLPADLGGIDLLFSNGDEARALLGSVERDPHLLVQGLRERGVGSVVLTMGAGGHVVASKEGTIEVAACATHLVDVTGAGDALIAGALHGLVGGLALADASRLGALLASLTLEVQSAVVPDLSPQMLAALFERLSQS